MYVAKIMAVLVIHDVISADIALLILPKWIVLYIIHVKINGDIAEDALYACIQPFKYVWKDDITTKT